MTASASDDKGPGSGHDLYRALILRHARTPQNFGPLPTATHRAQGINPLCGDKLELSLEIAHGGEITKAMFEGTGCAISLASASILTESIRGLQINQAIDLFGKFSDILNEMTALGTVERLPEELYALAAVRQSPSRVKCATLAWHALASASSDSNVNNTVTTE